ncbi:SDR family oxidoreductase [Sphingobacterium sp. SYP-B4668]|uniref:SDR family oxidoreductase n=1 Tax=Sphingobacterium sp. SYP-B4668 TaxID=2996035 RepID=UPI0022DDE540|nr:hypothetical protein [Sphingobacterium sp. SYP-B4668]
MREVLICGLNNYLGRRAVAHFANDELNVTAITRNTTLFFSRMKEPPTAKLYTIDLVRRTGDFDSFKIINLEAAFYFAQAPTLNDTVNIKLEILALKNYIELVKRQGCWRIVYVARLMDRMYLQPVVELFNVEGIQYTIVLKNCAVGKGSMLDNIFKVLEKQKIVVYVNQIAKVRFQPIAALDVIRWLQSMLTIDAFVDKIIELGGPAVMNFRDFFQVYGRFSPTHAPPRTLSLPKKLVKFIFTKLYKVNGENFEEFRHVIRHENLVDNTLWMKYMPFELTPIEQAVEIDC